MQDRFMRLGLIVVIALLAAFVAEPYVMRLFFSAQEPRPVMARGDLAPAETTAVELFRRASPSVVHVFARSGRRGFARGGVQSGTGFVWDEAGHVVTNNHVVQNAGTMAVRLADGTIIQADLVGSAANYDIAVLRLGRVRGLPPPLPVGSSADLQVGQWAFAIGNPFGLDQTLTTGVVSALQRTLPTGGGREIADVIQTDAPINPGNSGGPLLDSAGRVICVNTAIFSPSGASAGIGFAVPIDVVNTVVPQLIRNGRVPTPGIGIVVADDALAARLDISGIIVMRVTRGSPAERAGLRGTDIESGQLGDVIVAVDGEPVRRLPELTAALEARGIGAPVELTVERDGTLHRIEVQVADVSATR